MSVSPVPELEDDVEAEVSAAVVVVDDEPPAAALPELSDAADTVVSATPVTAAKLVAPLPPPPQAISPATVMAKLTRKRRIGARVAETRDDVTLPLAADSRLMNTVLVWRCGPRTGTIAVLGTNRR